LGRALIFEILLTIRYVAENWKFTWMALAAE